MKRCMLCGCIDESGAAKTCPKCGEATWQQLASLAVAVEEALVEVTAAPAPKRGRPRKS